MCMIQNMILTEVKNIIQDSTFKNSHLIIGPIYSKNIKLIRGFQEHLTYL